MDAVSLAIAMKAAGKTAEQVKAALDEYLEENPEALDQDAVEAIVGEELAVQDAKLGQLKSAINSKVDSSMMQKCEVVDVEASANLWNKDDVSTGLYYKNGTIYTGGSYDNYRYNNVKISVVEGDVLSFFCEDSGIKQRAVEHIACFTADGTINAGAGISNTQVTTFTIPSNITGVILNANVAWANFMVLKNAEQAPTEYIPYAEEQRYYVATNDFIPENVRNQLVSGKQNAPETAGTAGQVLGLGNNLEPVWIDQQQVTPITIDDELSATSSNPVQNKVVTGAIGSKVDSSLMKKCELVEIEATANKWNKDAATVGMVHTNGNTYTGGSFDNYMYGPSMDVQPGDVLRLYCINNGSIVTATIARVACYNSEEAVVPSAGSQETTLFTVPEGITSIIVTVNGFYNNSYMLIVNDDSVPAEYIPYRAADTYYIATSEFIPEGILRQLVDDKVDKNGTKQVTVKNCEFVDFSPNLFDPSAIETGLLNKSTGAVLSNYTNYVTSGWIAVEGNEYYTFSSKETPYIYWCWYDSSKGWISGGESNIDTKQSPSNAKYIRFSIGVAYVNSNVQFEKGNVATNYMAFGTGYIQPEYMPSEVNDVAFNIPQKVYALVGYETNIYFENLVEDWTKYRWDVTCAKGMQLERGYRITPEETDVGSYTLTFFVSIGKYIASFGTTLVVVSGSAGSGVNESLIVLGDSTTANGIAITKLNENLSSNVYHLSTLGTKGTAPNNHEGRSGWRFSTYFSNDADNPFYNPTSQTFDASYYFTNTGVAKPTWFFINLGINDVFGYTSDADLTVGIGQCKDYLDAMIASINAASPSTKIGVCLTIPPNHSQDAFGKEYKCGQNRNRYKRNNLLWVHAVIAEYDNREAEGIYLIPIFSALDTVYNMGFETMPVNARNTAITYQSPIGNGGVHPVESGYWQIADVYTAFLKGNAE